MGARLYGERYLRKVQRHGLGIAEREDQASALAKLRADGAEDVGRFGSRILGR